MESDSGGTPRFYVGESGASDVLGGPGGIAYPAQHAVAGAFNRATGTITIDIPRNLVGDPKRGDILRGVTASTFTQNAPGDADPTGSFGPTFNVIDSTGPFDVTIRH